jgi:exopolysaccharide biosynthesis polyprenyl glycosylphosphotransferase
VLGQSAFRQLLAIERKRTERSSQPFVLLLVEAGDNLPAEKQRNLLSRTITALSRCTRGTDLIGWYNDAKTVGVAFTDLVEDNHHEAITTMLERVTAAMHETLTIRQFSQISISIHIYPDDWEHELFRRSSNPVLYPDFSKLESSRRFSMVLKRAIDLVLGSSMLLLALPLFGVIALAIKVTSRGPVFFRQQRVGQHGRTFMFVKFRSMRVDGDERLHVQWFEKFMNGKAEMHTTGNGTGSFKLTNDPRVTRVGRILRRTSLDELPQLLNVLKGDMSLVGPRPPIPYEVEAYQPWHRMRVLQVKPGITGLWQVSGRSRVTFDEMVRLDIRYARTWSLWLDLKILLKTPRAVLMGEGAY